MTFKAAFTSGILRRDLQGDPFEFGGNHLGQVTARFKVLSEMEMVPIKKQNKKLPFS